MAPPIVPQSPPVEEQRRHWYANEIGVVPLQLPLCAVRVWPRSAVPEIDGCVVTAGGVPAAAPARAPDATTAAAASAVMVERTVSCTPWFPADVTRM